MAEAETKIEAKPAAGSSKLVPLLLVVNSGLLAAVLAMLVLKPGGLKHAEAAEKPGHEASAEGGHGEKDKDAKDGKDAKAALPGPTLRLPDFVVHLRDVDADRYARMSFELELPEEKAKEAINVRLPQIRDAFLSYLSDRTAEDLRGSEAMVRIKAALAQKLSELAPAAAVRGLYVTELVIQ